MGKEHFSVGGCGCCVMYEGWIRRNWKEEEEEEEDFGGSGLLSPVAVSSVEIHRDFDTTALYRLFCLAVGVS